MQNHIRPFVLLTALCLALSACTVYVPDRSQEDASTTGLHDTTDTPYTAPTRPDAQAAADEALAALPEADFAGASLIVATADSVVSNPLFPASDESAVDRARLARNAAVTERYGVSFIPAEASLDTLYTEARDAQNAGLYYADLLMLPAEAVGRFTAAGLLRNLRNLPFWQNSDAGEAAVAGHAVYADLGEAMLTHANLPAVFFNRSLAESLGYDFYAAYEAGEWTWSLYLEAAVAAAALDGVSGHAHVPANRTRYIDLCFASSGLTLVDNTAGQTPTVAVPEGIDAIDDILRRLVRDALYPDNPANDIAAIQSFSVGGVLFCTAELFYMDWIYDSPAVWGILPLPSLDGRTYTPAPSSAPVLCVTENNNKFEMTGLMLAALNAASTDVITEAYITDCLQNRLRDWQSAAMLEAIADNVVYSFATLYGSGAPSLAYATTQAVYDAANGGMALSAIVDARAYAANSELAQLVG